MCMVTVAWLNCYKPAATDFRCMYTVVDLFICNCNNLTTAVYVFTSTKEVLPVT